MGIIFYKSYKNPKVLGTSQSFSNLIKALQVHAAITCTEDIIVAVLALEYTSVSCHSYNDWCAAPHK